MIDIVVNDNVVVRWLAPGQVRDLIAWLNEPFASDKGNKPQS